MERLAAAIVIAGVSLGGCADMRRAVSLPPVNPESPVAPAVAVAATERFDVPRLTDVPPTPKDVPLAADVKLGVISMVRCRNGVQQFASTHPPLSSGTASFAADLREVAQVDPADVPPPDSAARSDAESAQLRAYATPPAAIASGPAPTAADAQPPTPEHSPSPQLPPRAHVAPAPASQAPTATLTSSRPTPTPAAEPPFPAPLPDPTLARCS